MAKMLGKMIDVATDGFMLSGDWRSVRQISAMNARLIAAEIQAKRAAFAGVVSVER